MSDALDDGLVEFLYRWNRTERPLGFDVIDLDTLQEADGHPGAFANRTETTAAIRELADAVTTDTDPYVGAKIRAVDAFIRCLEGEVMSFDDYIEATLGVRPQMIDDVRLQYQYDINAALMDDLGHPHTTEGVTQWAEANTLDPETVRRQFADADRALIPLIKTAVGADFDVAYRTDVVDEDAYWFNWTSTDDSGEIVIRFNIHARHRWQAGDPVRLAIHEVGGHAVQTMTWKRSLQNGVLPRSVGVSTVFTPDAFLMEGLAETLPWFCPELPLSDADRWAVNRSRLAQMAWNNVHIMANAGMDEAEALQYLDRWCPGYAGEAHRKSEYDNCKNHPLLRGYLHAYGIGGLRNQEVAEAMTAHGRREYLNRAYSGPLSAVEIIEWPAAIVRSS